MTRPLLSRDERERVADLEARELDGIMAQDEAEELAELRARITPTMGAEIDRALAVLAGDLLTPRDVEDDPPPPGEWVIGLWMDQSPPQSGTMRRDAWGTWQDEIDEVIDEPAPSHWIRMPVLGGR